MGTDKEVIAEEEKELIENEKTDEPEKTEEVKEEEEKTEPKKVHLLQKLFGKRKDFVVPKIDEVTKTDKEIINEEEKTEEKAEEEKEEKEKVQHKFKKLFSMKKAKKEEKAEEKVGEGEEKKDDEKKDEEEKKDDEKKEGEEAIEEVSDVDVSTTTAEKKTLMQKLMTIKRDLMANKKEDKVEEEKKEGEEEVDAEKKEGEEEVKAEGDEAKEEETKDELGNEKPKPSNRIKKFFSMKRQRKTTETEEKPEEEKKEEEEKPEEAEKKEDGEVKEEEVVEEIIETILRIQLQNRTPIIPCLSAMQLKLESWLKFHGVKYENVQEKEDLPASALLPMQSNEYLTTLAAKEEKMLMPMELDAEQKNIQHAMISLAEKNIHFAILSWQCSNLENTLKGYNINLQTYLNSKAPLALLKLFFKNNFCKSGLKMVKSNGFSQSTTEEIEQLAKNDLKVLAEMLGKKEFFFGNAASLLDLVVFSHLAQLTVVEESVACTLRDHIKAEHENLIGLVDRMKNLTWGEDWAIATEKLDRNPHIPKPIEEQVKIIVDDVVEKATEEKAEETTEEEKEEEEKKEEAAEEKTE